jgi:broad specificity phosphatase PhoE
VDEASAGVVTRWWWIRHAPVTHLHDRIYGSTDPHADVSDEAAFRSLARRLPEDAIWVVSHLQRTHQTARAIEHGGYRLPEWIELADVGEQDFGALHGVLHVDHAASRSDVFHGFWPNDPYERAPGGESLEIVQRRVMAAVERLSAQYAGRDIVCVAHGGPILCAVGAALDLDLRRAVALSIPNLSLTRLQRLHSARPGAPAWRVLGIGERPL